MFRKGTKLYSILRFKCPHCHDGPFFESSNLYNLKKMGEVRKSCPKCARKYSSEPGFYQGSYYVTYALGVALFVAFWVSSLVLFNEFDATIFCTTLGLTILVLSPILYALSKIIWANLFFNYKNEK